MSQTLLKHNPDDFFVKLLGYALKKTLEGTPLLLISNPNHVSFRKSTGWNPNEVDDDLQCYWFCVNLLRIEQVSAALTPTERRSIMLLTMVTPMPSLSSYRARISGSCQGRRGEGGQNGNTAGACRREGTLCCHQGTDTGKKVRAY